MFELHRVSAIASRSRTRASLADVPSVDARGAGQHLVAALNRFNQRHPWSHNDRFHGWVLRRLPRRRETALEVGCGRGELAVRVNEE